MEDLVPRTKSTNKFAVFDLRSDDTYPKSLHEAAEKGNVSYITRQVERTIDFDINQRDKFNRTALHWAAEMGQVEAAEALVDYGCDITSTECNGRTAIHLAARSADTAMLQSLLEPLPQDQKEKLVNQTDMFGITPLFLTLQKGEEGKNAFQYLMLCGGKYNDMTTGKSNNASSKEAASSKDAASSKEAASSNNSSAKEPAK